MNPPKAEDHDKLADRLRPQFGITHRMALALEVSGVSVNDIADLLDVSRQTVSGYLHHRSKPPKSTLMIWAQVTGVSEEWLLTGKEPGEAVDSARSQRPSPRRSGLSRSHDEKRRLLPLNPRSNGVGGEVIEGITVISNDLYSTLTNIPDTDAPDPLDSPTTPVLSHIPRGVTQNTLREAA